MVARSLTIGLIAAAKLAVVLLILGAPGAVLAAAPAALALLITVAGSRVS